MSDGGGTPSDRAAETMTANNTHTPKSDNSDGTGAKVETDFSDGDTPSDGNDDVSSPAESDRGRFVDDDAPPRSELNRPSIDIEADHEVYQEQTEGQIGIRPIWAPEIEEVAQVTLSLGPGRVASALGPEEVDQLIAELEHAKEIAAEYSEGEK